MIVDTMVNKNKANKLAKVYLRKPFIAFNIYILCFFLSIRARYIYILCMYKGTNYTSYSQINHAKTKNMKKSSQNIWSVREKSVPLHSQMRNRPLKRGCLRLRSVSSLKYLHRQEVVQEMRIEPSIL